MPVKVTVVVIPRQDKEDFVWERFHWLADQVKKNEPGVSSYRYARNTSTYGDKGFVLQMEIDSMESLASRRNLDHHQEIARLIKEMDLLKEPLRYYVLTEEAGW